MATAVEPLRPEYFSFITYKEVELSSLEIELNDTLQVVFPDGAIMDFAGKALETLCKLSEVPVGFAKKLVKEDKSHVLAYLQKQLARSLKQSVMAVCKSDKEVLCFVEKQDLPLTTDNFSVLDDEILKVCNGDRCKYALTSRKVVDGDVFYYFNQGTKVLEKDPENSVYRYERFLHYSSIGLHQAYFGEQATRIEDGAVFYLQDKPKYIETNNFKPLMGDILNTIEGMDAPRFDYLDMTIAKLRAVPASLREVKEARQKLLKALKTDEDDDDSKERVGKIFDWRKISQEYDLKNLVPKPSKKWFMLATSPYNLFYVYHSFVREITHAPNTISEEIRKNAMKWSYRMLERCPDLAEKAPPKVTW